MYTLRIWVLLVAESARAYATWYPRMGPLASMVEMGDHRTRIVVVLIASRKTSWGAADGPERVKQRSRLRIGNYAHWRNRKRMRCDWNWKLRRVNIDAVDKWSERIDQNTASVCLQELRFQLIQVIHATEVERVTACAVGFFFGTA